jgi:hypothetical protein
MELEQIANGIYVSEVTRAIQPKPEELIDKSLQETLGHAESEEIAAAFVYASNEHGQWVAMTYDRLYEQLCKHIVLTMAKSAKEKGEKIPPDIEEDLEKGYYPSYVLAWKIKQDKGILPKEVYELCVRAGAAEDQEIFMLPEITIRKIHKAQQKS